MPAWVLESVVQGRVSARIFTFFLQFFSRREFLLYFFKFSNDFWGEVCMSRFARDRVRNIVKSYIKIYYMLYIAVNLPVGLVQDSPLLQVCFPAWQWAWAETYLREHVLKRTLSTSVFLHDSEREQRQIYKGYYINIKYIYKGNYISMNYIYKGYYTSMNYIHNGYYIIISRESVL